MEVKIVNSSTNPLPEYVTGSSAGMDLEKGISMLNTPGTIDADYRGDGGFGHTGTK